MYKNKLPEDKIPMASINSYGQMPGRSCLPLEDNRPQSVLQKKQSDSLKVNPSHGSTIQRYLYAGKGSTKPVPQDSFFIDEDDAKAIVPLNVVERIWEELGGEEKKYRDFFKIEILTQRAFPLRINSWDELTAARIKQFYAQEMEAGLIKEMSHNFKPGDKLYGIHDVKAGMGVTARPNVGRAPHTSELYNLLTHAGKEKHVIIDTINNVLGISAAKSPDTKSISDAEALEYLEFISHHPRYGPKFKDANEDIKKSCKAALEYTTTVKKSTVHFELSGMDLAQIVAKTDKSVTGAELRSIYRRVVRQKGKGDSPGIHPDNVRFYKFGKEVPAPWISDPELWQAYKPKAEKAGEQQQAEKKSGSEDKERKDDK